MTSTFGYPDDREETSAAAVRALEALLIEKGVITDHTVDKVLGYFESEMDPLNGQKIVARAWVDADFADLLVTDTPAAVAQLDRIRCSGPARPASRGRCSPSWASRSTPTPRCGCGTPATTRGGSSSLPAGAEGLSEEEPAALVTTESMMGVALAGVR